MKVFFVNKSRTCPDKNQTDQNPKSNEKGLRENLQVPKFKVNYTAENHSFFKPDPMIKILTKLIFLKKKQNNVVFVKKYIVNDFFLKKAKQCCSPIFTWSWPV